MNEQFPNITEDDPVLIEVRILDHFMSWGIKSPAKLVTKLRQYAQGRDHDSTEFRQAAILIKDRKPIQLLHSAYNKIVDYLLLVDKFIGEGYHGFIEHGNNIYPITVETRANWMETPWHPEDELEIAYKAASKWMDEHRDVNYLNGRVVLFRNFGFKAEPIPVRMKRSKVRDGLKKAFGSGDLFYDPKKHPTFKPQG